MDSRKESTFDIFQYSSFVRKKIFSSGIFIKTAIQRFRVSRNPRFFSRPPPGKSKQLVAGKARDAHHVMYDQDVAILWRSVKGVLRIGKRLVVCLYPSRGDALGPNKDPAGDRTPVWPRQLHQAALLGKKEAYARTIAGHGSPAMRPFSFSAIFRKQKRGFALKDDNNINNIIYIIITWCVAGFTVTIIIASVSVSSSVSSTGAGKGSGTMTFG